MNYASRNSFINSVPFLDQIVAWKYNTLYIREEKLRKQHYYEKKVRSKASLAGKPQDSGLLVNIEYLVSYPIGQNVSVRKEVRAKLSLYRISQSR